MNSHNTGVRRAPATATATATGPRRLAALFALCLAPVLIAAAPAAADPEEVPAEVHLWFEEEAPAEIVVDPDEETYDDYLQGLGVRSVQRQEVHEPHPVWQWSDAFVRGRAADREESLAFTETWVAGVSVNGEPGAIVEAARDEAGEVSFGSLATAGDAAEGFATLAEGEVLVYEFPLNAWYALSEDGRLRGLNAEGLLEVPDGVGLEEYAERTRERYADDFLRPAGTDAGGGAAFTDHSSWTDWLLPGGILGLILVGAGTAALSGRTKEGTAA